MDSKRNVTRRSFLAKAIAGALVLTGVAVPAAAARPIRRQPDLEYNMRVFYTNGKCTKVCYYDQSWKLLYCTSC